MKITVIRDVENKGTRRCGFFIFFHVIKGEYICFNLNSVTDCLNNILIACVIENIDVLIKNNIPQYQSLHTLLNLEIKDSLYED